MKYLSILLLLIGSVGCGDDYGHRQLYSEQEVMHIYSLGYYDGIYRTQRIAHEKTQPYETGNKIGCTIDYSGIDSAFRIDSILKKHKWFDK